MVVLNAHGAVNIDWDTAIQRSRFCVWKRGVHRSNFAYVRVDFWRESLHLECFDAVCKAARTARWPEQEYELPPELRGHQPLFTEPELPDRDAEEMLAAADGTRMCGSAPMAERALDERQE